jgi:tripartite-type tricarboxylate transporter receptor subunit TctC
MMLIPFENSFLHVTVYGVSRVILLAIVRFRKWLSFASIFEFIQKMLVRRIPIMRAMQRSSVLLASIVVANMTVGTPRAEDYPVRPVHVIVGFVAGTGADITARVVGQRMGQILGQQFVVENKPGAGTSLAAEFVARAPKDGYTLLMAGISNPINAAVNSNLSFNFPKDFAPIVRLTTTPNILVVHPSVGVKSVKELIELARAKPDQLSFGSSGVATGTHLSGELLKVMTGIKMVHVPYGGSPQAVTDLLAGRIQLLFSPASTVLQHVRDGKLVALASTEVKRTAIAADLPTMAEAGLPGFETGLWFGLVAPNGTPKDIIDKLNRAGNEALKTEEVTKVLAPQGIDLVGGSVEDFSRYLDGEMKRWETVSAAAGLKK